MPYTYEYPRPALTVDSLIFSKKNKNVSILLIQRDRDPFEGYWAFPGGFVDIDEPVEVAVVRELEEETGLKLKNLTQLRTFSAVDRDPRGRVVAVAFYGIIEGEEPIAKAADDARDAKWFNLNDLPKLAFDHDEILEYAIGELKLKN